MKKRLAILFVALAACAFSCCLLMGCGGSSDAPAETDLTIESATIDDFAAAFSNENKDFENVVTVEGTIETTTSDSYKIRVYMGGESIQESIYCDMSAIDASAIPENGTMVKVHGTWKHMVDSPNDYGFLLYVDELTVE